ncbi:HAD family hydrolase [Candidatus Woesearchaeota archaeon]|nr:HAD family hydrolase [Candidatus Woesearchaeota archaeon]
MKAILFDMDGVLLDSHDAWFDVLNSSLKKFGRKEITVERFDRDAWAQSFDTVAARFLPNEEVAEISKFYFSRFSDFVKKIKVNPEAKSVLQELKKKRIKTAIVSNSHRKIVELLLKSAGLHQFFDAIVGGDEVKRGKPAPDVAFEACRRLKVSAKDSIMVGDTVYDIESARSAGCLAIGFRIDADKRIENLSELLELC